MKKQPKKKPQASKNARAATKRKLTARQERFCELVAGGESQTEAYIKAGFKSTREAARRAAARLLTNVDIAKRVEELRKPVTRQILSTRDHKRKMLYLIMENTAEKIEARLKAIEIDAKLSGQFEPDRTELQLGNSTLQSIKERAAELAYSMSASYRRGTPAKLDDSE